MTARTVNRIETVLAVIGGGSAATLIFLGLYFAQQHWFLWAVIAAAATLLLAAIVRAAETGEKPAPRDVYGRAVSAGVLTAAEARAAAGLPRSTPAAFQDRLGLYDALEVWLVADRYNPFTLPSTATHVLVATGSPREITSYHVMHRVQVLHLGRPLRHVIRPSQLPGLSRMPSVPHRLTVEQIAELDFLTRYELPLPTAA